MKNIEIEIRIHLDDDTALMKWLKNTAKYVGDKFQHDIYFEPKKSPYIFVDKNGFKDADEWLRIRVFGNEGELCYKKWHRDPETRKSLYADEIELKIGSVENLKTLLSYLDFQQISEVKKNRESWVYKNFKIEKDAIENLGVFYEIEFKGEVENPEYGSKEIYKFLKEIGITNLQVIDRGYPWMQWNDDWKKMNHGGTL